MVRSSRRREYCILRSGPFCLSCFSRESATATEIRKSGTLVFAFLQRTSGHVKYSTLPLRADNRSLEQQVRNRSSPLGAQSDQFRLTFENR